jgi:hypothetical protein
MEAIVPLVVIWFVIHPLKVHFTLLQRMLMLPVAYTTSTTDENGATYNPILSSIMNYVRPSCINAFTIGQGSRMRNAIVSDPALR